MGSICFRWVSGNGQDLLQTGWVYVEGMHEGMEGGIDVLPWDGLRIVWLANVTGVRGKGGKTCGCPLAPFSSISARLARRWGGA